MDAFFLRFIRAERHELPVRDALAIETGLAVCLGTRMKSWIGKDVLSLQRL